MPRDVLDKMAHRRAINVWMRDGTQDGSRQTRKSPRKRRLVGSRPAPLPHACRQPQDARSAPASSEGYEGARQRRAILLRPPCLAAEVAGAPFQTATIVALAPSGRARPSPRPIGPSSGPSSPIGPSKIRTSNPIASRAGTRLHSSVGIMRCFATAHDTQESGPVPPQGPSRQKSRSPARGSVVWGGRLRLKTADW